MTQLFNTTTGTVVTITMIDPRTGTDYSSDFIAAGTRSEFEWNDDAEMYAADGDDIQWWLAICAENEALEKRLNELRSIYGDDAIHEATKHSTGVDLEDLAKSVSRALDEWLTEIEPS